MIGVVARATEDPREVSGRSLFAKGDYQQALDIYADLFAEKHDPLYLRNIGRCHQMLHHPEKAIDAFKEYLRKSRRISTAEREEVEGFIHEMEALQEKQKIAGAADSAPPAAPAPAPPAHAEPTPPPAAPPPPALHESPPRTAEAPPLVVARAAEPPPAEEPSVFSRWWFWTAVGAVAVAAGAAVFVETRTHKPNCPGGYTCP
jgi:hypothetical protein